jgi:hypothetical protein
VTIKREAVKAPVHEQIVVENQCHVLAEFKFAYWSFDRAKGEHFATFLRAA